MRVLLATSMANRIALLLLFAGTAFARPKHPTLLLKPADIQVVKEAMGKYPLLDRSYKAVQKTADDAMARPIEVPIPKDLAGGYSHEQHKQNYTAMQAAGQCFTISQDLKYARFVRDMLLQYSTLIPTLKNHPKSRGASPGRLFHQALNDCNWLVYTTQAYDAVYETLTPTERATIETGVFRPLCQFLTVDLKPWFNLRHNHGLWAVTAVGLCGYVLNDRELVQQALLGTEKDGNGGYLAQLKALFSPDGYYVEGPYYARYATLPLFLFAQAIENNQPEQRIYQYGSQLLKKVLYTTLQQTDASGRFYPFNDALKEKDWTSSELVTALSFTFGQYGPDPSLVSVAKEQGRVLLNRGGVQVAQLAAMYAGKEPPFERKSLVLTDGPEGKSGGLTLLRGGPEKEQTSVVFKYTSHGMSHGHFDKLNLMLYTAEREILTDYGAVRFLNVPPKDGGRYLPENDSFGIQTIAHNTVVIDQQSHFGGSEKVAEQNPGEAYFSDLTNPAIQIVSAKSKTAYPGVTLHRTLAMIPDGNRANPLVFDVFRVVSDSLHQVDLPFYYAGQLMSTSFKYEPALTSRVPLGRQHGYQHIWTEARASPAAGTATFTWLNTNRFYSVSTATDANTTILLTRVGANDPNFNLRPETAMILRQNWRTGVFASVIETHGQYDARAETTSGAESQVKQITVLANTPEATVVSIELRNKTRYRLAIANADSQPNQPHQLTVNGQLIQWQGYYQLVSQ